MTKTLRIPSYRLHKASAQAVVVLNGTSIYLGKWNTPESHAEYERVVAEWLAQGRSLNPSNEGSSAAAPAAGDFRVSELILAFVEHAKKHYRHADGTPTGELDNLKDALKPLRKLYGETCASEFGPLRLRALRAEMLKANLCRTVINARINRIRRVFKRKANPQRGPKDHYSVNTFQQTVRKTCKKLGLAVWTVLQVRHTRATEVRAQYGLEGAAASLGDRVEAAQIYAENNRVLAQKIARDIG